LALAFNHELCRHTDDITTLKVPPPPPPPQTTCALQRCIGVDGAAANVTHHGKIYQNDTAMLCKAACHPLAAYEWVANAEYWQSKNGTYAAGQRIYAIQDTVRCSCVFFGVCVVVFDQIIVCDGDECSYVQCLLMSTLKL
jgi:hypothetical protein